MEHRQVASNSRPHTMKLLPLLLVAVLGTPVFGQTAASPWDELVLRVTPLGGITTEGVNLTYGGDVGLEWRHPGLPFLFVAGALGYRWLPLTPGQQLPVWTGALGGGAALDMGPFSVRAQGGFGALWWQQTPVPGAWDWDYAWRAGVSWNWRLSPFLSAELAASYQALGSVFQGVVISLGAGVHPAPLFRPLQVALRQLGTAATPTEAVSGVAVGSGASATPAGAPPYLATALMASQ